jgi:ribosome-binding factor A
MKKQGDGRRVSRVEQEVQKTVAQFLLTGFRAPLKGLVTVSRVMMPGDLRTAKVYISVLGSEADRQETLSTLQARAFEVQKYIGQELRMRFCPKLSFHADDTTEHVMKIDRILHELERKKATKTSEEES